MGTVIAEKRKKVQKQKDNTTQTKDGGAFAPFLTLNSKSLKSGKHTVFWYGEMRLQAGTTSHARMRCTVDASAVGHTKFKNMDQDWQSFGGISHENFNDGDTPAIALEVKRETGTDTVEIRNLRIRLERDGK